MANKLSIIDMYNLAEKRGGKCLSSEYVNNHTKLEWECKEGHKFFSKPNDVQQGHWCPNCAIKFKADKLRGNIEEIQIIAEEKGGICLSKEYVDSRTNLKFRCNEGHVWITTPDRIVLGTWCPYCSHRVKLTIEEMRKLAEEKGGKCLSTEYINSSTKLEWQCKEGHTWMATPRDVKGNNSWCPICAIRTNADNRRGNIKDMQILAESRGGKCLSERYYNNKTKLLWICSDGHEFEAAPDSIIRGRWCPYCSFGLSERICRNFFEKIFGKKFHKVKPDWLTIKKKGRLELDGYCEELRIAFEYQGQQHYSKNVFFHQNRSFESQIEYDKLKRDLCMQHNVKLIEIPYFVEYDKLGEYIIKESVKKGLSEFVVKDVEKILSETYDLSVYCPSILRKMQEYAESKNGKCLSKSYLGRHKKLIWECEKGHIWKAVPNNVINNKSWCPKCGDKNKNIKRKLTIEMMKELAKSKGGECLSEIYVDANTKLNWQCKYGHKFSSKPGDVQQGHWCPYCAGLNKKTIGDMHLLAKNKNGKCLSNEYINSKTKIIWQCDKGHIFESRPNDVIGGHWCPKCSRTRKK